MIKLIDDKETQKQQHQKTNKRTKKEKRGERIRMDRHYSERVRAKWFLYF